MRLRHTPIPSRARSRHYSRRDDDEERQAQVIRRGVGTRSGQGGSTTRTGSRDWNDRRGSLVVAAVIRIA